jgi:CheY-like chemotaxis protein
MFHFQHHNRLQFPNKHILIAEDNLSNQKRFVNHFAEVFDPEGDVQISFVPGALMAAGIIHEYKVDLIILDHDMPTGTGTDLLNWMKQYNITIPVITASGIPQNNAWMMSQGATFHFQKEEIISGTADKLINDILYGQ